MPTYDYRCTECGREIEVMHGMYGSGPEKCEYCGGAMRKALSPPAIHFKGKGWAKKDAATAKKATAKGSATSDKDSKKSDTTANSGEGAKADASSGSSSSTESKGTASSTTGAKTE